VQEDLSTTRKFGGTGLGWHSNQLLELMNSKLLKSKYEKEVIFIFNRFLEVRKERRHHSSISSPQ
jgi:hypothetical protein